MRKSRFNGLVWKATVVGAAAVLLFSIGSCKQPLDSYGAAITATTSGDSQDRTFLFYFLHFF